MTPRERFIAALERRPLTGRVPHFELVFYLTMEAFGKIHPDNRNYSQWDQMEERERQLHRKDIADIYIQTAEQFEHSAILLHPNPYSVEETLRLIDLIRDRTNDKYFLIIHGDATFSIPDGNSMVDFSYRLFDEPEAVKSQADIKVVNALKGAERFQKHGGLDGFALCADYCLNKGRSLSPNQFEEFVIPYLVRLIKGFGVLEFITLNNTKGVFRPTIDQLLEEKPMEF
ncbi:MAG: hypothetical protein K8S00_14400, partial [Bacteroidales bacterium]|nr:hypothetical protein [Bacteroidales bacterium]